LDPTGGNGCQTHNNDLTVGADSSGNLGALISQVICVGGNGICGNPSTIYDGYMLLNSGALSGGTGCSGTNCNYVFNGVGSSITVMGCFSGPGCTAVALLTATFVTGDSFNTSGTVGTFSGSLTNIALSSLLGTGYHFTGGSGDAITISLNGGSGCTTGQVCTGLVDDASASVQFSPIPEPATLSVLGACLLALGTGLRRKMLSA
jgi:hypothetical protein